jgi:hypothetical protein
MELLRLEGSIVIEARNRSRLINLANFAEVLSKWVCVPAALFGTGMFTRATTISQFTDRLSREITARAHMRRATLPRAHTAAVSNPRYNWSPIA